MNNEAPPSDSRTQRRLRFDMQANPVKSGLDLPPETEVSFVSMDAVGTLGGLRLDDIRPLADVYDGYTYFADGDVCVAKITPCFENGKGALASGLTNGTAFGTTELHVLRPSPTLDAKFLFYLTMSHEFRSRGESEMLGAGGQKRVPEAFLKNWSPVLPSLEDQRRIAQFLDEKTARIDALIEKKRALLDRLAEKRQALITQSVTKGLASDTPMKYSGFEWLGNVPKHWNVIPVKRLRNFITSGPRGWAQFYANEGNYFLRMTNVTKSGIEIDTSDLRFVDIGNSSEAARTAVRAGDLLITITAQLGEVAIVRQALEGAYINQHLALLRINQKLVQPDFLANFLSTDAAKAQFDFNGQGGTKQGLGFEQIDSVKVALPPIGEQLKIQSYVATVWDRFSRAEAKIRQSIEKLSGFRTALITDAVLGQLPRRYQ